MRMRHIVICVLPALQCFSMLPHEKTGFSKISYWIKNAFRFSLQLALQYFLSKKNWAKCCWGRHVYRSLRTVPIVLDRLKKKLEFSGQIFEKFSNTKFHENPSSRSQVFPCGRMDRRTDMTKLVHPFRSLAKAPKHSDMYVTSTFKLCVFMYRHIHIVVYLRHSTKRGSSQFNCTYNN